MALLAAVIFVSCGKKEKYNLVFIVSNEAVQNELSSKTPSSAADSSIQNFYNSVVNFNHVYAGTSQVGPFWGMLLSGQHPFYNGVFADGLTLIPLEGRRFGGVLQNSGYKTAYFGAWNLGNNGDTWSTDNFKEAYGFDEFKEYMPENVTQFLNANVGNEAPFALIISQESSKDSLNKVSSSSALETIVHELIHTNQYQNTFIVVTSAPIEGGDEEIIDGFPDNVFSNLPFKVKFPESVEHANESNQLMSTLDVMPTILGFLHIKEPKELHGRNLSKEILKGAKSSMVSTPVFQFYPVGYRGVISESFSYVFKIDSGVPEGLMLKKDSHSSKPYNYFMDNSYSGIKDELNTKAVQWMEYYEDEGYTVEDLLEVKSLKDWEKLSMEDDRYKKPIDELKKLHGNRIMYFHGNNNYDD